MWSGSGIGRRCCNRGNRTSKPVFLCSLFCRAKYHKLKYGTELNQGDMKPPSYDSGKRYTPPRGLHMYMMCNFILSPSTNNSCSPLSQGNNSHEDHRIKKTRLIYFLLKTQAVVRHFTRCLSHLWIIIHIHSTKLWNCKVKWKGDHKVFFRHFNAQAWLRWTWNVFCSCTPVNIHSGMCTDRRVWETRVQTYCEWHTSVILCLTFDP